MQALNIVHGNFSRLSSREPLPKPVSRKPRQAITPEPTTNPFQNLFNSYAPLKDNIGLFETIREAIPFIDTAIIILNRLIGTFEVETYGKEALKKEIEGFIECLQQGEAYEKIVEEMRNEFGNGILENEGGIGVQLKNLIEILEQKYLKGGD